MWRANLIVTLESFVVEREFVLHLYRLSHLLQVRKGAPIEIYASSNARCATLSPASTLRGFLSSGVP